MEFYGLLLIGPVMLSLSEVSFAARLVFSHKYFGLDERYEGLLDEKTYFRHFPIPRLKRLHPKVANACYKGAGQCLYEITSTFLNHDLSRKDKKVKHFLWPFDNELDRFQYKVTATYFLCWFTQKRNPLFSQIHPTYHKSDRYKETKMEYKCTDVIKVSREYAEYPDIKMNDFRTDEKNFACAAVLFCPDPCYGKNSEGHVPSLKSALNDAKNPCRSQEDKTCGWAVGQNDNMEDLMRNKFNITCNCDEDGFRWNSQFKMCVDIDECYEGTKTCSQDRMCQNLKGSAVCLCKVGLVENADTGVCEPFIDLVDSVKSNKTSKRKERKYKEPSYMRIIEILLGISAAQRTTCNVFHVIMTLTNVITVLFI